MHDVEHTTVGDDSAVKGTQTQPQEERTFTPLQKSTTRAGKLKPSRAWRYTLVGGTILLVLTVIFAGILSFNKQTVSQPSHPRSTPVTKSSYTPPPSSIPTPSATPINSQISSGHYLSMTIVDGVAYVGTVDNAVYALRASEGTLLWHSKIEGAVSEQPQAGNGVVYVTSYVGQGGPGHVYALRTSDGSILWHLTSNNYSYLSLPTTDSRVAYVSSQDGIDALNTNDGSTLWHYSTSADASGPPLAVNGVVYASSYVNDGSGTLHALRASDGARLWQYTASGFIDTPMVSNGVVYITSDRGTLAGVRASDGHELWKQTLDANLVQSPQLVNGVLYMTATKILPPASSSGSTGSLLETIAGTLAWNILSIAPVEPTMPQKEGVSSMYAVRASDGTVLWHYTMGNGKNSWASWFSVEHGVVYADASAITNDNASQGYVYALNSGNGSVLWDDKLQASPSEALLTNGVIYLNSSNGSDAGAMYALRAGDGSLLWNYPVSGPMYNAPYLVGTAVYVGADNGMVYALGTENGRLLWHYQTDVGV